MKLLGISGSLQAGSANTALLEVARAVAAAGVELTIFDDVGAVPAFNPDIASSPAVVDAFRARVQAADGIVFATPEYAHGLPGSLKNLLDWLVGTGELYEKRVVIASAAPAVERGKFARADLERTLRAQGALVLDSVTIAVPTRTRGAECDDPDIRSAVADLIGVFRR